MKYTTAANYVACTV